ncbi:MAG: MmgE/PrpD family protein [Acetobacteraceae bacterium]|nr:MmgE/PrpD family protein [Acetobacteraceae bacterium]
MSELITERLADYVLGTHDFPEHVRAEARRSFMNVLGCAIGGGRHEAVDILDTALAEATGAGVATMFARGQKSDVLHACFRNGLASSVYSYDDTHAEAIVHPAGQVMAAVLALAERKLVSGREALTAFALGVEVICRLSKAVSVPPARGNMAWSQTGITVGVGTALAAGKLLGLNARQMRAAIGIAASQAAGIRSLHGTMCVALMPAHAGQTGLRAAMLAMKNFTGGNESLERRYGFLSTFCEQADVDALTGNFGERFEILKNTYKPYPCGIVIHPMLDAILQLKAEGLTAEQVARIDVKASPGGMALCNRRHPKDEFEAHVSLHHWIASALIKGTTGIEVLSLPYVLDPVTDDFQDRIHATEDVSRGGDSTELTVYLRGGGTRVCDIAHGIGSASNPMTNAQLETKFRGQSVPALGAERTEKLIAACWGIDDQADAGAIARGAS